jgi:hypothetical protein
LYLARKLNEILVKINNSVVLSKNTSSRNHLVLKIKDSVGHTTSEDWVHTHRRLISSEVFAISFFLSISTYRWYERTVFGFESWDRIHSPKGVQMFRKYFGKLVFHPKSELSFRSQNVSWIPGKAQVNGFTVKALTCVLQV